MTMPTPTPSPYPTATPPAGEKWSAASTHCITASPTPTATNPDGSVLPPAYSDCAVSGYVAVPEPTATATVQATTTVNADSSSPYAGGYNTSSTGYGSWTNFVVPITSGIFFIALMIYCVGLLVRWAKMALGGGDGALE